jgi:hypothetical protein
MAGPQRGLILPSPVIPEVDHLLGTRRTRPSTLRATPISYDSDCDREGGTRYNPSERAACSNHFFEVPWAVLCFARVR